MAGSYAAYPSKVEITGTPTTMTTEACSLVSGKIYQITATAKRVVDPDTAVTVYDNGSPVAATQFTLNYMFGKITFDAGYTPTTPITITGKYLPRYEITTAKEYSIDDETDMIDSSVFSATEKTAQVTPGLKDVSGSIGRLDWGTVDYGGGTLFSLLTSPSPKVLSIQFGTSGSTFRALVAFAKDSIRCNNKGVVEGSINWSLWRSEASTLDSGSAAAYAYSED